MRMSVTGATGFIGGTLVPVLLEQGHELTVLARNPNAVPSSWTGRVRIIQGDVTDEASCASATENAEAVFHLAAAVAIRRSEWNVARKTNELGTRNVVEASLKNRVARFVHVSSVAAIGAALQPSKLLNEESPNTMIERGFLNFDSKVTSEKIALDACRSRGLDVVIVNPSMVFGAGDAKKPARKGSVLATRGKLPFYPSGGISVVAVEDVTDGMIQALSRGRKGERYILSGENLRFKEVLGHYARLSGHTPPRWQLSGGVLSALGQVSEFLRLDSEMSVEAATASGLFHWYDHSKARKELGFNPRAAELAIKNSVDWILGCRDL